MAAIIESRFATGTCSAWCTSCRTVLFAMTAISETETIQYTRELRNILPDGGEQLESKEEIYCTVQGVTPLNCACTVGRIKIKIGNIAGVGVRSTTLAYSLRADLQLYAPRPADINSDLKKDGPTEAQLAGMTLAEIVIQFQKSHTQMSLIKKKF